MYFTRLHSRFLPVCVYVWWWCCWGTSNFSSSLLVYFSVKISNSSEFFMHFNRAFPVFLPCDATPRVSISWYFKICTKCVYICVGSACIWLWPKTLPPSSPPAPNTRPNTNIKTFEISSEVKARHTLTHTSKTTATTRWKCKTIDSKLRHKNGNGKKRMTKNRNIKTSKRANRII